MYPVMLGEDWRLAALKPVLALQPRLLIRLPERLAESTFHTCSGRRAPSPPTVGYLTGWESAWNPWRFLLRLNPHMVVGILVPSSRSLARFRERLSHDVRWLSPTFFIFLSRGSILALFPAI